MDDEVITIEITKHNSGWLKGEFSIDYGEMCPTSTDKEHLLKCIKEVLEEFFEIELED